MARRHKSTSDALTGAQEHALSYAIQKATNRLLGTVPPFPLTRDEVEEFFAPRGMCNAFREAVKFAPDLVHSRSNVTLRVHMPDELVDGKPRRYNVDAIHPNVSSWDEKTRHVGFMVPLKQVEGHAAPEGHMERLRAWVKLRWKAGVEAGYVRVLVEEAFIHAKTPNQLQKIWPELLQVSPSAEIQALLSKIAGSSRAQMPEGWTKAHQEAVPVANFIIAKCAMLPDFTGATGVGEVFARSINRTGDAPLTKFGRHIAAI